MIRPIMTAFVLFAMLGVNSVQAQPAVQFKNFVSFRQIVAGIDFYASNRQMITPYEKPAAESIERLKNLFGTELPKGAIFICSTLAQKDSIYEPMVLKRGYAWALIVNTPDVRVQETMARIKSQMGGQVPAELLARFKSRSSEMLADAGKQMATTMAQQIAHAVIQTMLDKDLKYRSSRLDDMGKSPLPDWLDIGIASYASGATLNLSYLQQHMDQTFPMEDVIAMSRPFVASSYSSSGGSGDRGGMGRTGGGEGGEQGGGGFSQEMGRTGSGQSRGQGGSGFPQGMPQGMSQGSMQQGGFGGRGMSGGGYGGNFGGNGGGFGGNGGQRGGSQRNLPKDEQDRMLFDGQASTFFAYLIDKVGIEKVKQLVKQAVEGQESRQFVTQPDILGPDFSKIEDGWAGWVKNLKDPQPQRQGFQGPS
jgi:hypothetical protein